MLAEQLRTDLTAAMRAKDTLVTGTLRMALAAIKEAEVAGKEAKTLSDDEVLKVLAKEAKKRREAAEAFAGGGRSELAATELAEEAVLLAYLPAQLDDAELDRIVAEVFESGGYSGREHMGAAMKQVNEVVAGRADGGAVAAKVRARLGM